jgi:hypothetical protein
MNVEIGTESPVFLFWEYLFQIFGILSLQCTDVIARQNSSNNEHKTILEKILIYGDLLSRPQEMINVYVFELKNMSFLC